MLKKFCSFFVAMMLLLTASCAAVAAEYRSDELTESYYQAVVESLQMYLNGDEDVELNNLYNILIERTPGYRMSTQLAYYVLALDYIEAGKFDLALVVLDLLAVDESFDAWLEETEEFGTMHQVERYAQGRMAEAEGRMDDAVMAYGEAGDFHDAVQRRMDLALSGQSELAQKYNEGLRLFQSGKLEEALKLMRVAAEYGYGQSASYLVLIEDMLSVKTTATPGPEQADKLWVSKREISSPAGGENRILIVDASGVWTVKCNQSWVHVSRKSSTEAVVEVSTNPDTGMRSGVITFTCGKETVEVKVHQPGRTSSAGSGASATKAPTSTPAPVITSAPTVTPFVCSHPASERMEFVGEKVYVTSTDWEQEITEICMTCGAVTDTWYRIGVSIDSIPSTNNSWEYEDDGPTPNPVS